MDREGIPMGIKVVVGLVIGFIALAILFALLPFTQVEAGEKGVVLRMGQIDRVLEPGLHWRTPFIEHVEKMDVTTQKEEANAGAASKDLQSVSTQIALNYNLEGEFVGEIYRDLKQDYVGRIITPAIQEAVKSATAKYTAEELITRREEVKGVIFTDISNRLAPRHIVATELLITNFDFSPQFNAAIEAKVQAEQDALASKNKLEQTKYEAEQKVVSATAEAEAIRIQAQAVTSQGGADYVKLKTIEKWNGQGCTSYCGLDTATGLLINR